ncbi:protein phosphatase 2C [Trifolium repens]|nr:protein phosphatase 2C [Trifolium repens]
MSRSISDRRYRSAVIAEPEVMVVPRMDEDEFLILASDGLWDVMSNKEACSFTRRVILKWYKDHPKGASTTVVQSAADFLTKLAIKRGSEHNITVIIIGLKSKEKNTH